MAFSIGFIIGPVIGAYFARGSSFHPDSYINQPAILALSLGLLDILLVFLLLKESLPVEKRVSLCASVYVNCICLFITYDLDKLANVANLGSKGPDSNQISLILNLKHLRILEINLGGWLRMAILQMHCPVGWINRPYALTSRRHGVRGQAMKPAR